MILEKKKSIIVKVVESKKPKEKVNQMKSKQIKYIVLLGHFYFFSRKFNLYAFLFWFTPSPLDRESVSES